MTTNLFHTDWDIHVGGHILDKDTFNILRLNMAILRTTLKSGSLYLAIAINVQEIVLVELLQQVTLL